jgi:predicted methyltransferase/DNA-directed RNA polymerase subunit RPC12/RpoP
LQEGGVGVRRVLQAYRRLPVASTRAVSRDAGLPLPIVAAIGNELRERRVLTRDRPSRLTTYGVDLLAELPADDGPDPTCPECQGHEVVIPPELTGVVASLDRLVAAGPAADLTLDQAFCTAETKVRRVLLMIRYGILPSTDLLLVGDDDLMSVTVAMVAAALDRPLARRLGVVDLSADVLDLIEDRLADLDQRVEIVHQDLRDPLEERLAGRYEAAMTDPPYTPEGARLFLSRAVEGLRPGAGRSVVFSFGPKGPAESLEVQRSIVDLGLTTRAMHPDFNAYHGAGVIGGHSHLQHLITTDETGPVVDGPYGGIMYTADKRAADREYLCLDCGTRPVVGPGAKWTRITALKEAGCPGCGGHRFRPLRLVR